MACIGQVRLTVLRSRSRNGSVFKTYPVPQSHNLRGSVRQEL